MTIQQHEHPAPHAARDTGGAPDVHLAVVEDDSGDKREGLIDGHRTASYHRVAREHGNARRRVLRPLFRSAGRDHDSRDVDERPNEHEIQAASLARAEDHVGVLGALIADQGHPHRIPARRNARQSVFPRLAGRGPELGTRQEDHGSVERASGLGVGDHAREGSGGSLCGQYVRDQDEHNQRVAAHRHGTASRYFANTMAMGGGGLPGRKPLTNNVSAETCDANA